MPIPDFQSIMLPFLKFLQDGQAHTLTEIKINLTQTFQLTEDELKEPLPSGRQAKFDNRIGWAKTYLKKAGIVDSTARSTFRLTERGKSVLATNPAVVNVKYLERFPEFLAFHNSSVKTPSTPVQTPESEVSQTPEENLEASYQKLRNGLAQELLDTIKTCSPRFFENLVLDLLVAMGYGGSHQEVAAVGRSGDGGVDGLIKEDKLGLDVIYIQAKRWENVVGRPIVQSFAGSLEGFKARKGVFITTSRFTKEAEDYVKQIEKKIILIDGEKLAQLMIDYGVGVTEMAVYTIKRLDHDYFTED